MFGFVGTLAQENSGWQKRFANKYGFDGVWLNTKFGLIFIFVCVKIIGSQDWQPRHWQQQIWQTEIDIKILAGGTLAGKIMAVRRLAVSKLRQKIGARICQRIN